MISRKSLVLVFSVFLLTGCASSPLSTETVKGKKQVAFTEADLRYIEASVRKLIRNPNIALSTNLGVATFCPTVKDAKDYVDFLTSSRYSNTKISAQELMKGNGCKTFQNAWWVFPTKIPNNHEGYVIVPVFVVVNYKRTPYRPGPDGTQIGSFRGTIDDVYWVKIGNPI